MNQGESLGVRIVGKAGIFPPVLVVLLGEVLPEKAAPALLAGQAGGQDALKHKGRAF